MKEFLTTALPWICIGIGIALCAVNHFNLKKAKCYYLWDVGRACSWDADRKEIRGHMYIWNWEQAFFDDVYDKCVLEFHKEI